MVNIEKYTVEIDIRASSCCSSWNHTAALDIYAKNEQHAWQRASEIAQEMPCVYDIEGVNTVE